MNTLLKAKYIVVLSGAVLLSAGTFAKAKKSSKTKYTQGIRSYVDHLRGYVANALDLKANIRTETGELPSAGESLVNRKHVEGIIKNKVLIPFDLNRARYMDVLDRAENYAAEVDSTKEFYTVELVKAPFANGTKFKTCLNGRGFDEFIDESTDASLAKSVITRIGNYQINPGAISEHDLNLIDSIEDYLKDTFRTDWLGGSGAFYNCCMSALTDKKKEPELQDLCTELKDRHKVKPEHNGELVALMNLPPAPTPPSVYRHLEASFLAGLKTKVTGHLNIDKHVREARKGSNSGDTLEDRHANLIESNTREEEVYANFSKACYDYELKAREQKKTNPWVVAGLGLAKIFKCSVGPFLATQELDEEEFMLSMVGASLPIPKLECNPGVLAEFVAQRQTSFWNQFGLTNIANPPHIAMLRSYVLPRANQKFAVLPDGSVVGPQGVVGGPANSQLFGNQLAVNGSGLNTNNSIAGFNTARTANNQVQSSQPTFVNGQRALVASVSNPGVGAGQAFTQNIRSLAANVSNGVHFNSSLQQLNSGASNTKALVGNLKNNAQLTAGTAREQASQTASNTRGLVRNMAEASASASSAADILSQFQQGASNIPTVATSRGSRVANIADVNSVYEQELLRMQGRATNTIGNLEFLEESAALAYNEIGKLLLERDNEVHETVIKCEPKPPRKRARCASDLRLFAADIDTKIASLKNRVDIYASQIMQQESILRVMSFGFGASQGLPGVPGLGLPLGTGGNVGGLGSIAGNSNGGRSPASAIGARGQGGGTGSSFFAQSSTPSAGTGFNIPAPTNPFPQAADPANFAINQTPSTDGTTPTPDNNNVIFPDGDGAPARGAPRPSGIEETVMNMFNKLFGIQMAHAASSNSKYGIYDNPRDWLQGYIDFVERFEDYVAVLKEREKQAVVALANAYNENEKRNPIKDPYLSSAGFISIESYIKAMADETIDLVAATRQGAKLSGVISSDAAVQIRNISSLAEDSLRDLDAITNIYLKNYPLSPDSNPEAWWAQVPGMLLQ